MRSIRRTLRGLSVLLKTTKSRSAVSKTSHNDLEKRNPYRSKSRHDADVGFFGVNYIMSDKESDGNMPGIAPASTTYKM